MIPYFASETYQLFGITFRTWGTLVALGYALGTYLAWRRAKTKGLDQNRILDLAFWILIAAFIGARLFHVLFYDPSYYFAHPLDAIDPRKPGYSMFGGLIGAALMFTGFVRKQELNFLTCADALVWGLPWGISIGRIGCFLIHDHPGLVTAFFLGVRYPDGLIRHDLGLYLSLIGFATGGLFLLVDRFLRDTRYAIRDTGLWLGIFMIIEGLTRFSLDFLRIADARYFGLTPTQWLSIPLAVGGAWLFFRAVRMKKMV